MPSSRHGFLLPAVINPPDDICIAVHVPNDPNYIRAFWGVYEELGYWWQWEREPLKLGRLAAARWRRAVLETHETWDRYGDLCDLIIDVNVTCGECDGKGTTVICGCCGPGTYSPPTDGNRDPADIEAIPELPNDQIDDGETPPPGWETYPEYKQDKCNRAYAIVEDFVLTLANFGSFGAILAALSTSAAQAMLTTGALAPLIVGLMAVGMSAAGAITILLGTFLAMALLGTSVFLYFNIVLAALDEEALVCCLYNAGSNAEAQECFREEISSRALAALAAEPGDTAAWLDLFNSLVELLTPTWLFSPLFAGADLLDELIDKDCSMCAPIPDPGPDIETDLIFFMPFPSGAGFNQEVVSGDYLPITGEVTQDLSGKVGEAGKFNNGGITELLAGDYPTDVRATVSLWVRFDQLPTGAQQRLINKGAGNVGSIWFIESYPFGGHRFRFKMKQSNGTDWFKQLFVPGGTQLNTWYHLVATWYTNFFSNVGVLQFWLDGVPSTVTEMLGPPMAAGSNKLRLGSDNNGGFDLYGSLDQVRIYNRVLEDAEIQALYNGGLGI